MKETDTLVQNQYQNLPKRLQEYVLADTTRSQIRELLKDQPLQKVQIDTFGVEVMLVLLQLQSIGGFAMNIKHNMQISMQRADEIARNTKRAIFLPVQDYLIADDTINKEDGKSKITNNIAKPIQRQNDMPSPPKKEKSAQNVEQKIKKEQTDALDIFKKRLTAPVHTKVREEQIDASSKRSDDRNQTNIANKNPSSEERIAADPYKETID